MLAILISGSDVEGKPEFVWELYQDDAANLGARLFNHPLLSAVSGLFFLGTYLVVVEMDLPYDQRHVAEYGDTFAPMEKGKFEDIIAALIGALPFSQFAL